MGPGIRDRYIYIYMSYSLNSLKGGSIGEYYRGY